MPTGAFQFYFAEIDHDLIRTAFQKISRVSASSNPDYETEPPCVPRCNAGCGVFENHTSRWAHV